MQWDTEDINNNDYNNAFKNELNIFIRLKLD